MPRKPRHLRFEYETAQRGHGDNRHAQVAMKDMGITYQHSTPQTMGDQWWFWNCENVPETLPEYITDLTLDPMKCIGWGLSQEDAEKIASYAP